MLSNQAFLFIKPEAVTDKVKELVEKTLSDKGIRIVKKGELKSEVIDKKQLIDNHYYAIASKATILKPKELNVPADKFKGKFGLEWQAALDSGKVFNAMDGCEFLGVDADEMDKLWAGAKKADKLIKFGGGFYCGDISKDGKQAYIFNGFFMSMRAGYVVPGKSIFYYVVQWDSKKLAWADFRSNVCGVTDPEQADAGSLRGQIFSKWEELGLKAKPNVGQNAVHASASPFEGLSEKMNWLGFKIGGDSFGTALLEAGIPAKVLREWGRDPQVTIEGGKKGSCFDYLEDKDAQPCVEALMDLWNLNRPSPIGKASGLPYDFSNEFAKIITGKTSCHKVFENKNVLAFLDKNPLARGHTIVIPKVLGFASFLDMPSQKASELTGELSKLARAVKAAVDATDVKICTNTHDGHTVNHPKFHLVPQGTADKPGLSDEDAKKMLVAFEAALHPPAPLKRAKFTKVSSINPDSSGLNLSVKVTSEPEVKHLKNGKAYEVKAADASAVVTVSLREDQKDALKFGKCYELRNASVKMLKGHIAIIVDKWGKIEEASESNIEPNTGKDISATEYELVKA
jgi:diadenosine tetraphosphate (Ap4A) HIT family hydrolase/nucleoside diphosphate kinase